MNPVRRPTTAATLRVAACPAAVSLAVLVGACGGSSPASTSAARSIADPTIAAQQAIQRLDAASSGRVDARIRATLALGGEHTYELREHATFADAHGTALPHYDITASIASSGAGGAPAAPQTVSLAFDGSHAYMRRQASPFAAVPAAEVLRSRRTYKHQQDVLGPGRIPLLSLTPADWIGGARAAGDTTIDGVPVRRVVGTLDVERFFADMRQAKRNDFGFGLRLTGDARRLERPGPDTKLRTRTIELFISKGDDRLRRLRVRVDGAFSNSPFPAADLSGSVRLDLDVDVTGLDEPQTIAAPGVV